MPKIISMLFALMMLIALFASDSAQTYAKGNLSSEDSVKNVLIYIENSNGEEVLVSQLKVSDMLEYLNDHFETYGKVHNYAILDKYVTTVHQEAQGFSVQELLDYAVTKSNLPNINELSLDFNNKDAIAFWEIDGNAFDAVDTYTADDLYGVARYNFPALFGNWDYEKQSYGNSEAIWNSREEEQVLLSITAYSQRYIVSPLFGTGEYNMENYFDNLGILDTARTVRLMLPMTEDEFRNQTSTAANSRYGICYILLNMENDPAFSLGHVAQPSYRVIDGDEDEAYENGYWYFTFSCATEGATIYYNDNSVSSYMPTETYTSGQVIKLKKNGKTPVTINYRAVKEGYSDEGIQTASSNQAGQNQPTTEVVVTTMPATAVISVQDSFGKIVAPNSSGVYTLIIGETYSYTANAEGYLTKTGLFTVCEEQNLTITLQQAGVTTLIALTAVPAQAELIVIDENNNFVNPNANGYYPLISGKTYSYSASAIGYLTKSGDFTVLNEDKISIILTKDLESTQGPSQIVLSWTADPSTSASIIWNDNNSSDGYVQYLTENSYTDDNFSATWQQVNATAKTIGYGTAAKTYYEAALTNLTPNTAYCYRVGSSDNWSNVNRFVTAPLATQHFSFMYMGDVQHAGTAASEYPIWGLLLNNAYQAHPNIAFGLMGGDMVESGSDMNDWSYFLTYASDVFASIPMLTTNGNHESNFIGGKPQFYTDILALPTNGPDDFKEEFYSFNYGSAHITILNSWALSSEQNLNLAQKNILADWLTSDLAAASNAKYKIVMVHHPIYALANDVVANAVREEWAPILEAGNVDLVLCGHQHVYSRSYPMTNGQIDYDNGITFVMGNSGQKFYSTADTTYQEKTIYQTSTYQIIDINGDTLSLFTYDNAGNLLDSWSTQSNNASLKGDVDHNGSVDITDVMIIFQAILNYEDYNQDLDVNSDGFIDVRDAQLTVNICLNKAA